VRINSNSAQPALPALAGDTFEVGLPMSNNVDFALQLAHSAALLTGHVGFAGPGRFEVTTRSQTGRHQLLLMPRQPSQYIFCSSELSTSCAPHPHGSN
jgi:hypothetical protein